MFIHDRTSQHGNKHFCRIIHAYRIVYLASVTHKESDSRACFCWYKLNRLTFKFSHAFIQNLYICTKISCLFKSLYWSFKNLFVKIEQLVPADLRNFSWRHQRPHLCFDPADLPYTAILILISSRNDILCNLDLLFDLRILIYQF